MTRNPLSPYIQQLPVGAIAPQVNQSLSAHPRLVVTAPPGAGKSTLLPLTILQGMPDGKLLMLEPRRLAARQIAERMAAMLGETVGETVGYRVRFDTKVSDRTRIEVLTEGILSRMLIADPTLEGVATVVFDEFHERSLASDTAFALTLEAQQVIRPDLRVVVMSATIDTTALCQALDAPLLESEGRMFPVEIIHDDEADVRNCATQVATAVRKAHRIHTGDILAFLPGQAEIMKCREALADTLGDTAILPLYGMLPPQAQRQAILPSPPGQRKVVLATPVAETSVTIEGVRTVIDAGFCRKMVYDARNGLSHLETVRISADMARQRSGRAGRVCEGVCYRLWSKATELRMDDCRQPEICDADLAPMLLDIAAWGEPDVYRLPWLTPPPQAHVAQARQLLFMLGAVTAEGAITTHGRLLARWPCHPRIAQMLTRAETPSLKALAADIAALLEEKDVLDDMHDADINSRIALLRDGRRRHQAGRWGGIERVAKQYRDMARVAEDNAIPDPHVTGELIAAAYPERIAMQRADGGYRLASGETVALDSGDDLCSCRFLAVASVGTRIFLAAPLSEETVGDMAQWRPSVFWDSKQLRVVARNELRLGTLLIDTRPLAAEEASEEATRVICEAAKKDGASMFTLDTAVQRMQQRIATVAEWHPEMALPDVSTPALMARAAEWLPLYSNRGTTAADTKRIDMSEVIWGLLDYAQQTAVDRIAPTHIAVPTGSRIRIDYRVGAEAPVLSVRLQECFGMTETPRVDDGKRPVLMELLSPGFKPVQLTQDLHSFWLSTYFDVRKELRRRYPKHHWPDHPLEAEAVKGVAKRGK